MIQCGLVTLGGIFLSFLLRKRIIPQLILRPVVLRGYCGNWVKPLENTRCIFNGVAAGVFYACLDDRASCCYPAS